MIKRMKICAFSLIALVMFSLCAQAAQVKYIWKGNSGYIDDKTQWYVGTWKGSDATAVPGVEDQINFNVVVSPTMTLGLQNGLTVAQMNFASSVQATIDLGDNLLDAGKLVIGSGKDGVTTTRVDIVSGRIKSGTATMVGNTADRGPGLLRMTGGTSLDVGSANLTVQYSSILDLDNASVVGTNLTNQTMYFTGGSELRIEGTNALLKTTGIVGFKSGSALVFCPPRDAAPFVQTPIQVFKLVSNEKANNVTNCTLRVDAAAARKCSASGGGKYLLIKGGVTTTTGNNGNFTVFPTVEAPNYVTVEQDPKNAEIWITIRKVGLTVLFR